MWCLKKDTISFFYNNYENMDQKIDNSFSCAFSDGDGVKFTIFV